MEIDIFTLDFSKFSLSYLCLYAFIRGNLTLILFFPRIISLASIISPKKNARRAKHNILFDT